VRPSSLAAILAGTAASALLASGCGDDGPAPTAAPAAPISSRVLVSGNIPRVRPADLRAPIAEYRRHVVHELGAMLADAARLRSAVQTGDLAAARSAWLESFARYQTIGAAYGAFGELDARIDGTTAGLAGGERSPDFVGLHRIELALWERGSTTDAAPYTRPLIADVRRLRARARSLRIDPLEYVLRSHEVLEDTLHLQLSGQASPWSGAALVALRSNLAGTEVVLESLRRLVARRDPRVLDDADQALSELRAAVRSVTGPGGRLPRWDRLPQRDRELIAGRTAAAAEALAYVPELVDPRPPRPVQRVFGTDPEGQ
jgi:iron uptake system component EfeO/high-affinity iron transporter